MIRLVRLRRSWISSLAVVFTAIGSWSADGADSAPQPYFVSVKVEKAFMREGPSDNHRIKWVYQRKSLPLEVIASFDVWRRVRDMDGEIGWMHMALLSRERTAIIIGKTDAAVLASDDPQSDVVAQAQPGAIGRLIGCERLVCEIKFEGASGWIDRTRLWGVHDGEEY